MSAPRVRVRPHRRVMRQYYVRGVKGDRATGGVLMASSREDARDEFREKHPGYEVVQVNEREQ